MQTVAAYTALNDVAAKRAALLFQQGQDSVHRRTDDIPRRVRIRGRADALPAASSSGWTAGLARWT